MQPFDASEVVYRTVDAEGFVVYRQNFYAAPWRLLGQNVAVRVTESELVIHDTDLRRGDATPTLCAAWRASEAVARNTSRPAMRNDGVSNSPHSYAEFGAPGTRFLEGLLASNRFGKSQAERVLTLAAAYPRADVLAALERAVRYGALQPGGHPAHPRGSRPAQDSPGRAGRRPPHRPRATVRRRCRPHRDPRPTTRPCWARTPTMPKRPTPKPHAVAKRAVPSLHEDVTTALRTLGVTLAPGRSTPRCRRRRRSRSATWSSCTACWPARPRRSSRRAAAADRRGEVPRADDPGGVRLGVQRQGRGPAEHRATG